ncbi:MAG: ABC transporter permease [Clostridia bacterium]|nr:ABC transporter permease [Clostridia bacterium]NCC76860.1 ABC transporter permease [Clostridia bacterium]
MNEFGPWALEFWADYGTLLIEGTGATIWMVMVSTLLAHVIGLPIGVLVVVTDRGLLLPIKPLHAILEWMINIGRSIPFIILMIALIPFTRLVVGTSLGVNATIVPLVIASVPFVARLTESALKEIPAGVVESCHAMGATISQIVFRVLVPEAMPALIRGLSLTAITLVGYSAMAGAIGGGGLGDIAIRYGYHRYQTDVMFVTIILLIVLVQVIQGSGNALASQVDKRKR